MAYFKTLKLNQWRQFKDVEIDLSSKVTILTGTNGCGKTTILSLLSQHFGWSIPFASSPYVSKRAQKKLYRDIYSKESIGEPEQNAEAAKVGTIIYDDDQQCILTVPQFTGPSYSVKYQNQMKKRGLFIPSHRQQSVYNPVSQIPTDPVDAAQMYEQYRGVFAQLYQSGARQSKNPGAVQKEALIALALFGEGNSTLDGNEEYRHVLSSFQDRLRVVLPKELGFRSIRVRMPEVILHTESGDFALDAMSGGVASLFSITWQIHMFDVSEGNYTIIIDEPENHLHPSMQRTFLPSLAKAFQNARFVVATHSPFIVSSFRDSNIYMLYHDDDRRVISQELNEKNISGTANSILRDILGVESTIPTWLEEVISDYLETNTDGSTEERADHIMNMLKRMGVTDALQDYRPK